MHTKAVLFLKKSNQIECNQVPLLIKGARVQFDVHGNRDKICDNHYYVAEWNVTNSKVIESKELSSFHCRRACVCILELQQPD